MKGLVLMIQKPRAATCHRRAHLTKSAEIPACQRGFRLNYPLALPSPLPADNPRSFSSPGARRRRKGQSRHWSLPERGNLHTNPAALAAPGRRTSNARKASLSPVRWKPWCRTAYCSVVRRRVLRPSPPAAPRLPARSSAEVPTQSPSPGRSRRKGRIARRHLPKSAIPADPDWR